MTHISLFVSVRYNIIQQYVQAGGAVVADNSVQVKDSFRLDCDRSAFSGTSENESQHVLQELKYAYDPKRDNQ